MTDLKEHAIYSDRPLFEIDKVIAAKNNDETGTGNKSEMENFGPEWESWEPGQNFETDVPQLLHRFPRGQQRTVRKWKR